MSDTYEQSQTLYDMLATMVRLGLAEDDTDEVSDYYWCCADCDGWYDDEYEEEE